MAKNSIKYPIAFNKLTEKLVNISDATNDNKPNSKCKGNVESYIHWVTKEIFKEITEIELPEIFKDNLTDNQREKLDNQVNKLIEQNVPEILHLKFRKSLKKNLSESRKFQIEKVETEKEFNTSIGNVRIDIVTTINNQKLFIEPFFTNPIDDFKKKN